MKIKLNKMCKSGKYKTILDCNTSVQDGPIYVTFLRRWKRQHEQIADCQISYYRLIQQCASNVGVSAACLASIQYAEKMSRAENWSTQAQAYMFIHELSTVRE